MHTQFTLNIVDSDSSTAIYFPVISTPIYSQCSLHSFLWMVWRHCYMSQWSSCPTTDCVAVQSFLCEVWRYCWRADTGTLPRGVRRVQTIIIVGKTSQSWPYILWNSMTSTSFIFTELANTMKYGGGFLYNLVFTEWRHCVSQNKIWGRGFYITLCSPSDVTAFHRMKYGGGFLYNLVFTEWRHCVSQNEVWGEGVLYNFVFTEWRHCVSQNFN